LGTLFGSGVIFCGEPAVSPRVRQPACSMMGAMPAHEPSVPVDASAEHVVAS